MQLLAPINSTSETCKSPRIILEFSVTIQLLAALAGEPRIEATLGSVQRDPRRRSFSQSKNIMIADRIIAAVSAIPTATKNNFIVCTSCSCVVLLKVLRMEGVKRQLLELRHLGDQKQTAPNAHDDKEPSPKRSRRPLLISCHGRDETIKQ